VASQSEKQDDLILADQVRHVVGPENQVVSGTIVANVLISVLLVVIMRGSVSDAAVFGWFAVQFAFQTSRIAVARWYWRHQPEDSRSLRRWAGLMSLLATVSGAMWGAAGLLFFQPGAVSNQALLAIMLCGLASGSVPANGMLKGGLVGSVLAILVAFIARAAWENDGVHWLMAAMLSVYVGFVLQAGRSFHRVLLESLRRRHENEELIEQLREQTAAALTAQRTAEDANAAKSKFLAAASHDLRQPMHALALFSGALMSEQRPSELKELTSHIMRSVDALEMLFNALLDISKLDAGVTQPKESNFQVETIFTRLQNDFDRLAANKGLRLHIRGTRAVAFTDPQLLERILRNLVANALRYTDSGGIVVACRRRGTRWRIDVIDTGIGIPPSEHDRIFEEFYQIGNPERDRTKGLGLGLAIVRRLSLLLKLPISMHSRVGHGTVFSLLVPAGTARPQVRAETPDVGTSFNALRVLVVDDEPDVRLALTMLLRGWGCDVIEAESHVQAVAAIQSMHWQPQFAIVDFRLREGETGITVLDWLREHFDSHLPGVIITGDIAADKLSEVRSSGYRVLHKPVSPAKLRALLRGSLEEELG
jgi:signal transduction histidine kinase/ActR/RegA family two-component response regulator